MFEMHHDFTILTVLVGLGCELPGRRSATRTQDRFASRGDGTRCRASGSGRSRCSCTHWRAARIRGAWHCANQMAESIGLFDARRQLVAWRAATCVRRRFDPGHARGSRRARRARRLPAALREQARVLASLTDDLFELACIDAGTLTIELRETSVRDLVTSCVVALRLKRLRAAYGSKSASATSADRQLRPEQVQRVPQPADERPALHTVGRLGGDCRESGRRRSSRDGGRQRRGSEPGGDPADVRAVLA